VKIVQFENGKYGLRRRTITGYEFFDFTTNYWWSTIGNYSGHVSGCQVESLAALENTLDRGITIRVSPETQEITRLLNKLWWLIKKKFRF